MNELKVIRASGMPQSAGAYYVRTQAMAVRHHISLEEEFDEHDMTDASYIVLMDDVLPVATCRLYPRDEKTVAFGRVVVLPEYRGQGVGSKAVAEAEKWARELGYEKAALDARENKTGFYEKLGYEKTGGLFRSGPFLCILMEKKLI